MLPRVAWQPRLKPSRPDVVCAAVLICQPNAFELGRHLSIVVTTGSPQPIGRVGTSSQAASGPNSR